MEAIVGRAGHRTDLDGVLVDHVPVLLGVSLTLRTSQLRASKKEITNSTRTWVVFDELVDVQVAGKAFHLTFDLDLGLVIRSSHRQVLIKLELDYPSPAIS